MQGFFFFYFSCPETLTRQRFLKCFNDLLTVPERGEGNQLLIINEYETIVGRTNLFTIKKQPIYSAELGYRVGEVFLRKGIASKSLDQLIAKVKAENEKIELRAKTTCHNWTSEGSSKETVYQENIER